jgi:mannose-6-phosphate isomerase-like protein (cupin superfamily)
MARPFTGHTAICIPAGTRHNVRNTGDEPMRIATVYAPP